MVRHLVGRGRHPGEPEQELPRGGERRGVTLAKAGEPRALVLVAFPAIASNSSRFDPNRWINEAGAVPTSSDSDASVSGAGPIRQMTRAAAARISRSSTVRGRGDMLDE